MKTLIQLTATIVFLISGTVFANGVHANDANTNSADANGAPIEIQVQEKQVAPAATTYLSYNFGRVWVNSMRTAIFEIRNVGNTPLYREGFNIGGHGYSAYTNCPQPMHPGQVCQVEIRYNPYMEGSHSGRMYLYLSGNNAVIIDLWGEAYRY